jgi:hypothetical protein
VASRVAAAKSPFETDVEEGPKPAPNWRAAGPASRAEPNGQRVPRRRFLAVAAVLGISLPVGGVVVYRWLHPETEVASGSGSDGEHSDGSKADYLPQGCRPAPTAKLIDDGGQKLYSQVDYTTLGGNQLRFLLIPKQGQQDPATFYIMEDKVWVRLFGEFAERFPKIIRNKGWREKDGDLPWLNQRASLPVFNVLGLDAYDCAQWLQGNLPTPAQWDKAAGALDESHRQGPFHGVWDPAAKLDIAVGRGETGARPVGEAKDDVSAFGCHDMAGNGKEWTRDFLTSNLNGRHVPNYHVGDLVLLRGRDWAAPQPLLFKDLRENAMRTIEAADPTKPSPSISFRVVLEIP